MTNQLPTRPVARDSVYDVIDGERDYQNKKHGADATGTSSTPPLTHFVNLLIEFTDKLAVDVTVESPSPSNGTSGPLKRLREIAAIAIHAMEHHGAQPRENHVPVSAGITGVLKATAKGDTTRQSQWQTSRSPLPSCGRR
jgi:hypothetical protein